MDFSRRFPHALLVAAWTISAVRAATAAELPAGGAVNLSFSNETSLLLSEFSGGGSVHSVAEIVITTPDGTIRRKVPGAFGWENLVATRPLDSKRTLWDWRAQVESGDISSARQLVSVTFFDFQGLEIRRDVFSNAWPFAIQLFAATNGTLLEQVSIAHEGRVGFSLNPEITIQSPAAQSVFWNPTNVVVQAHAQYPDVLGQLQFFAGPTLIGTGTVSQAGIFKLNWVNPPSGDFTLSAIGTDETGETHGSLNFVPISIRYGMTYSQWRLTSGFFTSKEKEDPAISGPLADPDRDRAPNLLEFAAGTDPKTAASFPVVRLEPDGGGYAFVYRRRRGGVSSGLHDYQYADARILVETSTDLRTWTPATAHFSQASVTVLGGTNSEDAHLTINPAMVGSNSRYFRLRVELIP